MPPSPGITEDNVEQVFRFAPWTPEKVALGKEVVDSLIAAVRVILRNVPAGPDRTVAIRKIREARMDCNSAITHDGQF